MANRKELQNEIRIAQGLEPLPEEMDISEIDEEEVQDTSEILLQESAMILNDLISRPLPGTTTGVDNINQEDGVSVSNKL